MTPMHLENRWGEFSFHAELSNSDLANYIGKHQRGRQHQEDLTSPTVWSPALLQHAPTCFLQLRANIPGLSPLKVILHEVKS